MRLWSEKKEGLASLAVLFVLLLMLAALLLGPALYYIERYRTELRKDERVLLELRAIEAAQADIQDAQKRFEKRGLLDWVYSGVTAEEARLDVQRRVSEWLANTQVRRITPVTSPTGTGYIGVGVHAQFTATLDELLELAQYIEEARPVLLVERMRLAAVAQRQGRNQPPQPQRVTVQMTVLTFVENEDKQ